ncbi:tubulin--tyrosine ligase [Coemansia sp. Benny D115]|nr:tubulin--tyrosine ligase [Coemansia sp. Benny D115]
MSSTPSAAVIIEMDEPYVQEILEAAFAKYQGLIAIQHPDPAETAQTSAATPRRLMHWREYEKIDWDTVHRSTTVFSSAYCFRKGLIRKAQMAFNIKLFMAKNPDSILHRGVPETWIVELDDIDYLDEALMECYEVEEGLRENEGVEDARLRQQFILKPSLTGRGAGIYVFDTRERLEELLEREFESDDEEDEEDEEESEEKGSLAAWSGSMLASQQAVSQIREWVIQRYINKPLLIDELGGRKFHIRTYVLASGDLKVHVFRHMLALFAPSPYTESAGNLDDQRAHLTNTCLQAKHEGFDESQAVHLFWDLPLPQDKLDYVFKQICDILSDTFAAVSSQSTSFQAWANCIEQFGFDFLVDEDYTVFMLEANAYPDFKQTGEGLRGVVDEFMQASVAVAAEQFLIDQDDLSDDLKQTMERDRRGLVEVFAHKNERKW